MFSSNKSKMLSKSCVFGEPPYSLSKVKTSSDNYVDICDFGVISIDFTFDEKFDRNVPSICVSVYSSDEEAHTRPSVRDQIIVPKLTFFILKL